jgi:hypothetical protein
VRVVTFAQGIAMGYAVTLIFVIVCAGIFSLCVFLMVRDRRAVPRCDACGLPIKRGRCGYPDCDYFRKGHP